MFSGNQFRREARLVAKAQFLHLFESKTIFLKNRAIVLLGCPNFLNISRLGIIASRRICGNAIHRNAFKRVIREGFRMNQRMLEGYDLVVSARHAFCKMPREYRLQLTKEIFDQAADAMRKDRDKARVRV